MVQTFRARVRGVDSIDLRVEKASQAGSASVAVEFVRQGQGTARRSERVALADLAGSRWWRVRFAPIEGSQDGVYSIRIDVEGAPGEARLVLATTEGHEYPDGELSVDGGREPLDLVMNVDARQRGVPSMRSWRNAMDGEAGSGSSRAATAVSSC